MTKQNNKITVIDYGMGNLFNVIRAFEAIGCDVRATNNINEIQKAERLLLPGVGAFEDGIKDLRDNNLDNAIIEFVSTGRPLLGICLGMQLLMTVSEENGYHEGLNLIRGRVIRFEEPTKLSNGYKIPQIGWNNLRRPKKSKDLSLKDIWDNTILNGFSNDPYVYFLHSYFVTPKDEKIILSETNYGQDIFCSIFQQNQIVGCQFHPERSGESGLSILRNFMKL
tara:strand:- start:3188 stop:3859 length:672 start_codon:yes stop_codon:yes gene_type:complete